MSPYPEFALKTMHAWEKLRALEMGPEVINKDCRKQNQTKVNECLLQVKSIATCDLHLVNEPATFACNGKVDFLSPLYS